MESPTFISSPLNVWSFKEKIFFIHLRRKKLHTGVMNLLPILRAKCFILNISFSVPFSSRQKKVSLMSTCKMPRCPLRYKSIKYSLNKRETKKKGDHKNKLPHKFVSTHETKGILSLRITKNSQILNMQTLPYYYIKYILKKYLRLHRDC